nr:four helix bundle protein [Psychroflexus lacisalsi]
MYIALGSNTEIETQLIIAKNLKYLTGNQFQDLEKHNQLIGKQLINLIRHFENKNKG